MRTPFLAFTPVALLAMALTARADYAMPPIPELLRTVPIVVDATATKVESKTGAVHLKLHRVYRGAIETRELTLTKTMLTCVGAPPGAFGIKAGNRYVFLLQKKDTLYEGSTYWPVTRDPDRRSALRIQYPHPLKPGAQPIPLSEFEKKLAPQADK